VRHRKFIPTAVAPQTVHRIGNFYDRNIVAEQQIGIIRRAHVSLFVIIFNGQIVVNHFAVFLQKSSFEQLKIGITCRRMQHIRQQQFNRQFAVIQGNEIEKVENTNIRNTP